MSPRPERRQQAKFHAPRRSPSFGEPQIGSFVSSHVINGVRYDVFGRHDDSGEGFARFDIYDEDGNHINEEVVPELPPSREMVGGLMRPWHARRTVLVRPTPAMAGGWVWVGDKVELALSKSWWPQ